jgi:hypothetical protein
MTPARRTYLKNIMDLAWGLYRAELNGPCPRTFANALSGAWAWTKRQAAAAKPAWANGTHSPHPLPREPGAKPDPPRHGRPLRL